MNEHSLSSISLLTLFICCLFADNHPDRCEVLYHCGFDLYFTDSDAEDLFMCLLAICNNVIVLKQDVIAYFGTYS